MLTVHHLETSRSHRILWLLEELSVPYEIKQYSRHPRTRLAPPKLKQVHPLGKSPVIVDDGNTIAESGAIIEYIAERYAQNPTGDLAHLIPKAGSPEHLECRYFMHYAEGSLMLPLLLALIFREMLPKRSPFLLRPIVRKLSTSMDQLYIEPNMKAHVSFIEHHLAKHAFFSGEHLTIADFQMGYPIEILSSQPNVAEHCPNMMAYRNKLSARPAWLRAVEKGGPIHLKR